MTEELWQTLNPYLRSYDLNINRAVPVNAKQLLLEVNTGQYEAVMERSRVVDARRIVSDWTARQGVRRVQRHLQNRYGERYLRIRPDTAMYVTNIWSGSRLGINPEDVAKAAQTLAHLHNAMEGCQEQLGPVEKVMEKRHGTWLRRLDSARQQFQKPPALSQERSRSFPADWEPWLNRWTDLAKKSARLLEELGYEEWSQKAEQRNTVAWNGYRLNTLTHLNGALGIDQSLTPVRDHPAYDLATLCLDIADTGHTDGVLEAVETYALYREFSGKDIAIVLAFVAFPHQGLRLIRAAKLGRLDVKRDESWRRQAERQFSAGEGLLQKVDEWKKGKV